MTNKKTLFIDGKEVEFTDEPNLLEVIRKAGMNVPTFCYRPDLTSFGACRMCVVEVEGRGIQSSCTMPPENGIKIHLNTEKTRRIRKTVLELLLANHNKECLTCDKSGNCELQKYCEEYGIKRIRYAEKDEFHTVDDNSDALVRDADKCILCGACVRACEEHQGLRVLGFANRGSNTLVQPMAGKSLSDSECVNCGQCAAVCPTGAITIKSQVDKVWDAINNPEKKVVVQFAPSVRVAVGELFGFEPGENSTDKLNAALRAVGFDLVFDTNFSADLTIMEEANEFVSRLQNGGKLPLFTSCCPGWVRFLELKHPDMLEHLSSCKSPQGMMGAIIREYLPKYYEDITGENLVSVSIMPCTAKKAEALREEFKRPDGSYEIDYVLTTQEICKMIKSAGVDFKRIKGEPANSPFGKYTGAGTIFGVSGGVAEAAVRTAYEVVTGEELKNVVIDDMRGTKRVKTVELDLKGKKLKVKIVNTLKEAEKCIREIKSGEADYQILEVMACPGGCINGGGQPISCDDSSIKEKRAGGLYQDDEKGQWRKSHENPEIKDLYDKHLEKPNSHKAHELLHTTYSDKRKNCYISVGG
ncbi:MAG: [FeFe] hydrogenase, group A [Candidatus Gastranaerophilales bacterium]|nr:[FeFe] hydrogenase, group A [Candidatus Gastranaerophilales bacterium]